MKKPCTLTECPTFLILTGTVLLVEGLKVHNAVNIRIYFNDKLVYDYGVDFGIIQKHFRLVSDGAAVMADIARSSISRSAEEHNPT